MKQPAATVYLVTNLVNGKKYVGVTRFSVSSRWTQHLYKAKTGIKTYLYSAIRKYGRDKFNVQAVASCLSSTDVSEVERSIIQSLAPAYNQTNGGEITVGKRVSPEVVTRIIAKNTGLKRTPEMNKANSEQAKARYASNPDLKARMGAHLASVRVLIDQDKRIAAVRVARKGQRMSDEARAHLSQMRRGMRHTRDVVERIAEKHRKPVECITLGLQFCSVLEAAAHLRISNSSIGRACEGKVQSTAGGMKFRFL